MWARFMTPLGQSYVFRALHNLDPAPLVAGFLRWDMVEVPIELVDRLPSDPTKRYDLVESAKTLTEGGFGPVYLAPVVPVPTANHGVRVGRWMDKLNSFGRISEYDLR